MHYKKIVLLVVITLSVTSCYKLLTDTFPPLPKQVVMNGVLQADSVPRIHVGLSGNLSDSNLCVVPDAKVMLNNVLLVYEGNGYYVGTDTIRSGITYTCTVEVDGFEKLTKQTTVPFAPELISAVVNPNPFRDEYGWDFSSFELTFRTDISQRIYYQLIVLDERHSSEGKICWDNNSSLYINSNSDVVFQNEADPLTTFSNALITSNVFTLTGNKPYNNGYTYKIALQAISPDYYQYIKQAYVNRYAMNGVLVSFATSFIIVNC